VPTREPKYKGPLWHKRDKLGLSQREVAKRAGVSTKTVAFVEQGWRNITDDQATRIARAVGYKAPSDLWEYRQPTPSKTRTFKLERKSRRHRT